MVGNTHYKHPVLDNSKAHHSMHHPVCTYNALEKQRPNYLTKKIPE
jgi:hypothetical protein